MQARYGDWDVRCGDQDVRYGDWNVRCGDRKVMGQ